MRRSRRRDRRAIPMAVSIEDSRSCKGLVKASNESRRAADKAAASWVPLGTRYLQARGGVLCGPAALAVLTRSSYGPYGRRGTARSRSLSGRGGGGGNTPLAPTSAPLGG